MLKFIQYVCLLFLVCSCSTRNEESVIFMGHKTIGHNVVDGKYE